MTDEELKTLVASLAISQERTDAQIDKLKTSQERTDAQIDKLKTSQERTDAQIDKLKTSQERTDAQIQKTDAQIQKTDAQIQKTDAQIQKTDAQIEKIAKQLGGFVNNEGKIIEDQFFHALKKCMLIDGIQYDDIEFDMQYRGRKLKAQFDIVLFNSQHLLIVEVKRKPHLNDLEKLLKYKKIFPEIFTDYQGFQIHLGLAGESFYEDIFAQAKHLGIYLLQTETDDLKIIAP